MSERKMFDWQDNTFWEGETIAPCPFCGNPLQMKVKPVWHGQYRFVACPKCKAGGPVRKTEEEAIAAWNMRFTGRWEHGVAMTEDLTEI